MAAFGHYHTRSQDGSIRYLGATGEYIWSDYDDPRGFHVFDTSTRELRFVENPNVMFRKLHYDDREGMVGQVTEAYRGKIIKVVVRAKEDPHAFETFISSLEGVGPVDIQLVEDHLNADLDSVDDEQVQEAQDTLMIFNRVVDSMEGVDRDGLKGLLSNLYHEALEIGSDACR